MNMARYPKNSAPKLTSGLIADISLAIRNGAYVETAVALCGISKQTFYRWLRQGETEEAPDLIRKLSDAVKKGMAEAEMRDLAVIDKAAQEGEWTAAAWRLERKFPEKWGRRSHVQLEHFGAGGGPISFADKSDEELSVALTEISRQLELLQEVKGKKQIELSAKKSDEPGTC
jgi:hypothetical protein